MLGGKDYHNVDILFPFICALVDKGTGYMEDVKLTTVDSS